MIIVCLGNYGKKYKNTRHNFGRRFGEYLLDKFKVQSSKLKVQGEFHELENGWKVVLLNCYMNESGGYLAKMLHFVQHDENRKDSLIVVHDDLDIPFGEYKIQFDRGPAGHHGVESIIKSLGTQKFWRFRLGISNNMLEKGIPVENFVLMPFLTEEENRLHGIFGKVELSLPPLTPENK